MAFPSYAIAIIIIVVILAVSGSVYFIFRKRKGGAVGAVEQQSEDYISEKNDISPYAVRPLMQYNNNNNNNNIDTISTLKDSQSSSTTIPSASTTPYEKTIIYESDAHIKPAPSEDSHSWTAPSVDRKINLPLPPPSSSFFSDKMELDSVEANDLYASYMNVAAAQQDYVSIDLDEKPFLSNAAANISQKAATLRTNLRQSMRRKSSNSTPKVALNQFFDNASSNSSLKSPRPESTRMSRQSSSTSSRFPRPSLQQSSIPPSPRPDSPATGDFFGKFNNSSKKSLVAPDECNSSNKTMIDSIPPESYFSLPLSPSTPSPLSMKPTIQQQQELQRQQHLESETITMKPTIQQQQELQRQQQLESETITMKPTIQQQQELQKQEKQAMAKKEQDDYSSMIQEINDSTQDIESIVSDEEELASDENEDAAVAARRLIRSASRKSRTRSTLITDETAQAMFAMIASTTPSPSEPVTVKKYATLRNHNMEIDTASIRRANSNTNSSSLDIQKWSTNDSPLSPKRAIMSSTLSGSATVSGKKMAKHQQLNDFNNSTDDLFKSDAKSATLGRKKSSETTTSGPKSLRNLFTKPSADDKSSMVSVPSIASKEKLKESQQQQEKEEEEKVKSTVSSVIETDTPAPQSPITSAEPSPYSSKNNTLRKVGNNVDTIRRMLQSSWSGNNLKESGSNNSLSSSDYMGSVGSSYRPVASPLGSVNPRMQNQHLVSLSLKANASQQARSRPSMPIGFMNEEEGPMPTASFSSSTVRTMIPADEEEVDRSRIKPKTSVTGNILGSRQPRQPSKLGDRKAPIKKQPVGKKTPAQIEREKYLKSTKT